MKKTVNTRVESFKAAKKTAVSTQERILRELRRAKTKGRTCDEIEQVLQIHHGSASARLTELANRGKVFDSGERRPTVRKRLAIVWRSF